MPSCVIKWCKNNTTSHKKKQGITFHRFPSANEIWKKDWIDVIRQCRGESNWKPTKSSVVCSIHFDNNDLYSTETGRLRVSDFAVPTKLLSKPKLNDAQPALTQYISSTSQKAQRGKDGTQDLHRSDTVSSEEDSRTRSPIVQESNPRNSNRICNAEISNELSQRWTVERRVQFIQMYKKFECLWNPKHEYYKNQITRDGAYKEIMKVMGMDSVKAVIAKIRNLRNIHYNETLKAKRNSNDVSKLPWVPQLDFINDVGVIDRKLEKLAPTTQEETEDSYDSGSSEESSLIDLPDEIRIKLEDPLDQESEESNLQEKVSLPSSKDNDEFGLFGQTVAEQLRQLPLEVALETEEMILSTIRSQRIKILATTTSSQIVKQQLESDLRSTDKIIV